MKNVFKLFGVGFLTVLMLAGCGDIETTSDEAEEPVQEVSNDKTQKEKVQIVIRMLEEHMSDSEIEYREESKLFIVHSNNQELAKEIAMIYEEVLPMDSWEVMVDSMANASKSFSDILGDGYSLAMSNPANHDNLLIIVMDGIVIYDAMEDEASF